MLKTCEHFSILYNIGISTCLCLLLSNSKLLLCIHHVIFYIPSSLLTMKNKHCFVLSLIMSSLFFFNNLSYLSETTGNRQWGVGWGFGEGGNNMDLVKTKLTFLLLPLPCFLFRKSSIWRSALIWVDVWSRAAFCAFCYGLMLFRDLLNKYSSICLYEHQKALLLTYITPLPYLCMSFHASAMICGRTGNIVGRHAFKRIIN